MVLVRIITLDTARGKTIGHDCRVRRKEEPIQVEKEVPCQLNFTCRLLQAVQHGSNGRLAESECTLGPLCPLLVVEANQYRKSHSKYGVCVY